jgi:peptidylprolyl isomerase
MVGAGRDLDADSGSAAELYAVIGQAPRQLDRNVTLLGRVVEGMDIVSALPRGHGDLGFYQTPGERTPITSIRLGSDVPAAERMNLEALRTDSPTFAAVIQNRRFRKDAFYKTPAGRIDVCNMPLPVRVAKSR